VAGRLGLVVVGAIVSVLELVSEPKSVVAAAVAEVAALESPLSPIFTTIHNKQKNTYISAPTYLSI
jgi:hypothetical protein